MDWIYQSTGIADMRKHHFLRNSQVDNASYAWMGASPQLNVSVQQTAFEYTSTRSIFTMDVDGKVEMKITFLSPVSPDDLVRSSLPYSYMDVAVSSLDGSSHQVQLYTDISAGESGP